MPTYCFATEEGEILERFFRMADVPDSITSEDGRVAVRDFQAEGVTGQMVGTDNPTRIRKGPVRPWPMAPCCASGVHESQSLELAKHLADRGCPTEVVKGDPVYTSAAHRKKALKIRGFRDQS